MSPKTIKSENKRSGDAVFNGYLEKNLLLKDLECRAKIKEWIIFIRKKLSDGYKVIPFRSTETSLETSYRFDILKFRLHKIPESRPEVSVRPRIGQKKSLQNLCKNPKPFFSKTQSFGSKTRSFSSKNPKFRLKNPKFRF
jgi:hypothetical protein